MTTSRAPLDLALAMDVARRAVDAAAAAALAWHSRGVTASWKEDRSPVTEADRAAEEAILGVIRAAFPGHAVLAEESGATAGDGSGATAGDGSGAPRWLVDPLDGTRGFARGGAMWGPLVALEADGAIVAGAMALPAAGTSWCAARGLGAWRRRDGGPPERVRVSSVAAWEDATLSVGEARALLASPWREPVLSLAAAAASARCYGDLAGFAMVLDGRAEAWVECGVKPWDLGPIPVLVEEAGGRFSGLDGRPGIDGGHALASNGVVHGHVLRALAPS